MTTAREEKALDLRRVKLTFSLIYFVFMAARALFGPFITVYLQEKGLSASLIGVITGINSFVIILSQPLWGIVADKMRSTKRTLVLCFLCQAVFALSLMFVSDFAMIALCFCAYTSFSSAEGPLLDLWSLSMVKEAGDPNAMGQLKLWGCIGFALLSVLAGQYIQVNSAASILPFFAGVLVLLALFLSRVRTGDTVKKPVRFAEMQLGRILRDRTFLVFLVFIFVMQLAHRASYTFYPLLISKLGGDSATVGYSSALMFVSQAVVMGLTKRMLSRRRPEVLVMLSSFAFVLWHVFLLLATRPVHVMLSCLMDGPSFGLFTIATLYYLDRIAIEELRTTYQTVAYAVYFGLSGIVGNMLGGFVIDRFGYQTMYIAGIVITLTATALFFLHTRRGGPREAPSAHA